MNNSNFIPRREVVFFDWQGVLMTGLASRARRKKGKPAGQHGVEVAWLISSTPPARWDELIHSTVDTRSPFRISFENDQRGKTVYFALRWENTRGERGRWSDIMVAIIP
jgi:hypothetical protein